MLDKPGSVSPPPKSPQRSLTMPAPEGGKSLKHLLLPEDPDMARQESPGEGMVAASLMAASEEHVLHVGGKDIDLEAMVGKAKRHRKSGLRKPSLGRGKSDHETEVVSCSDKSHQKVVGEDSDVSDTELPIAAPVHLQIPGTVPDREDVMLKPRNSGTSASSASTDRSLLPGGSRLSNMPRLSSLANGITHLTTNPNKIQFTGSMSLEGPAEGKQEMERVTTNNYIKLNQPYTWKARQLVHSASFDYVFGFFLIANGVVIGLETNYNAQNGYDHTPIAYRVFDVCFCIAFGLELSVRLFAYRAKFFVQSGWQWNWFDSVIVAIQTLEVLTDLFAVGSMEEDIKQVGFLRVLRLARIVRLVRMVRLIPELKSMVYLIFASMGSFVWAMVLIVLLMYCVAVYFTDSAMKMVADHGDTMGAEKEENIKKYWRNVFVSTYSLFQAITGGDDWRNLTDVFEFDGGNYEIQALLFFCYVSFAVLVMLNLVTGVFVEGAQRIVKQDKDAELMRVVCKAFGQVDEDDSMSVTYEEFMSHLDDGSLDTYFIALDLSKQHAGSLFTLLDMDNSQSLSVDEFVRGCMRLRGPARSIDLAALAHDFQNVSERLQEDNYKLAEFIKSKLGSKTKHKHAHG
jgi:hypothetical protein